MHWMILPYRRYFEFSGRSRRKEYWWFFVFWVLLTVALGIGAIASIAGSLQGLVQGGAQAWAGISGAFWVLLAVFGLFFLASLIPMIAVQVRRLHDLGVSGWWYLAYIASGALLPSIPNAGDGLNGLVSLGWLAWMFFPGTKGANKFGEDPKDPFNAEVFA
ncbi:MAG: DUF805 domain-containing protein [Novosphingobium sp.]